MPTNGLTMREHWMLPILLAPNVLSQALPPKVAVGQIEHFESLQIGPFQPLLRIGFGEPPQSIRGIFDTGSSDVIVPKAGSAVCDLPNQQCEKSAVVLGDFNPSESSDVQELSQTFNASFGAGDSFDGPFIKTTTTIGETKVEGVQVALAVNGSLPGDFPEFPIFGVGPPESVQTDKIYTTMLESMKEKGVIGSRTMGIVLNRIPFENGSVVFGGFDKGKFKGELQEVPLVPQNGKIVDFLANMTSIRIEINDRPSETGRKREQHKKRGQQGQSARRSRYGRVLPRAAHNGGNRGDGNNGGNQGDGNNRGNRDDGNNRGNRGDGNNRGNRGDDGNNGGNRGDDGNNGGNRGDDGNNGGNRGNGNNRGNGDDGNNGGNRGNGNNRGNGDDGNNGGNRGDDGNNGGNRGDDGNNGGNRGNGNNRGNRDDGNNGGNRGNGNNRGNGDDGNNGGNRGNGNNGGNRGDGNNGGNRGDGNNDKNKKQTMDFKLKSSQKLTLFDTGGVILSIPSEPAEALAEALDTEIFNGDIGFFNCDFISANNKLLFGFNDDKTILSVPFTHIQISPSSMDAEDRDSGECMLGIIVAGDDFNVMGFPWMSAVYTVFDLDKNRLMFAEAVENSTQSDIQALT